MPVANISFSYDTDRDQDIHLALSKQSRRDRSAYIREVIRFYEANRGRLETGQIASRLEKIEKGVLAILREIDNLDRRAVAAGQEEESGYLLSVIDQLEDF